MSEVIVMFLAICCLLSVSLGFLLHVVVDIWGKPNVRKYNTILRDWFRGVWLLGSIALGWWFMWPVRAALRLAAGALWCAVVPLAVGVFVLPVRVARGGKITPRWAVAWLEWVAGLR